MAKIVLPTRIPVDDSIVSHYQASSLPSMVRDRRENAWVVRSNIEGLLAQLAQHGDPATGTHHDDGIWHGTVSRDEALTLATKGWSEPLDDVLAAARHVTIKRMTSLVPVYEPSEESGDGGIDVDAYLAGEENVYVTSTVSEHESSGRGSVRLIQEPCVSAGMSTDSIIQRGAIIAATVWALERAGVRVSLEYRSLVSTGWSRSMTDRTGNVHVYCPIKAFGEPFDLRRLMFWIGHPSASRRAIFAAVYRVTGSVTGDVGWSSSRPPMPARAVDIPALHLRDLPTIEQWLAQVCTAAGITYGKGKR